MRAHLAGEVAGLPVVLLTADAVPTSCAGVALHHFVQLWHCLCQADGHFLLYCAQNEVFCVKQVRKRQGDLLNYIVFLRVTPLLPNTFINVCAPIVRVPLPHFALGAHLRCCCALGTFFPPRWASMDVFILQNVDCAYTCRLVMLPLMLCTAGLSCCMHCMQKACSSCSEQLSLLAGTLIGCLPNNFLAVHAGSKLQSLTSFRDLYSPVRPPAGRLRMSVCCKSLRCH